MTPLAVICEHCKDANAFERLACPVCDGSGRQIVWVDSNPDKRWPLTVQIGLLLIFVSASIALVLYVKGIL